MDKKIGVAILGCGYWGVNYVRVFNEVSNARVAVICDQRMERLQEIGQRYPGAALTTDIAEALTMPGVDAAIICTGATTHFHVAQECLLRDKHVLVEKPLTTCVAHAQTLIELAEQHSVTLMVGHTFLYNAAVRKVKEYLKPDNIGDVYYLYASRTNLGPIRHDVNALWDLATHDVSIFDFLLEETPEWVSAVGSRVLRNGHEDVGFISLGYRNNVVGNIHVSWADPNKVRQLVVVGSNKRIVFDDLNTVERVKVYEKGVSCAPQEAATYGEFSLLMRDGDIISPRIEVSEPLKNQCNHFVDCIRNQKRPLTDGRAGLEVVKVMTAIDQSVAHQGAPVSIADMIASLGVSDVKQNSIDGSTLC